jgi:hypothetical protein
VPTLQIVLLIVVPVLAVFVGILSNWIPRPDSVKNWHVFTGLAILLVTSIAIGVIQKPGSGGGDPPHTTATVEDVGLSVASAQEYYRAIVYLGNPTATERLINKLHLLVSSPSGACAELAPVILYEVHDEISIDASGAVETGTISAESGPMSGLRTSATGLLNKGCAGEQLQLEFAPSGGILERQRTTPIAIDIPKRIKVTARKIPDDGPVAMMQDIPKIIDPANVPPVAFRVTAEIDGIPNIDSCFLLSDSAPSGKLDCDYVDHGRHVFWRQIYSAGEVREER